ncbi:MAG: dihydropteroate synthase [Aureliella sp.]
MHSGQHIHFVTGKLARRAVESTVEKIASKNNFEYSISVLPITVAALMTPRWLLRHLDVPEGVDRVVLPGHLAGDIEVIREQAGAVVDCGPRDIRDLPQYFGDKSRDQAEYGGYAIEIIAEVNHANRLTSQQLTTQARQLVDQGANVIDLGCTPGNRWSEISDAVRRLRDLDIKVSVDSFDPKEVAAACKAGAELVLSVNSTNCEQAVDWGAEVVVIPDTPGDEKSFEETIFFLQSAGVAMRLDPILEPIGCGFASSLTRYARCRQQHPDARMMMGIGNITELTDVDSSGVNVLLLGICEELQIRSVLTTQVINWARSSVRECDLARRLVHYACQHGIPPKHLEPALVMLRDVRVHEYDFDVFEELAAEIRDKNIRIANSGGEIHATTAGVHVHDSDAFALMEKLLDSSVGDSIDRSHAFYLGYEMCKAAIAQNLSKQYDQDQPLDWGMLRRDEKSHRLPKGR